MNDSTGDVFVSIIIATYNAGHQLAACLQSIGAQAAKGIEVVIVDGGSTDNTMAIVQASGLPLLRWVSEADKGIYDALNKGVRMARGKRVYFLGADDRLLPGFSELLAKVQDDHTVYYGDSEGYSDKGEVPYILMKGSFSKYRLAKFCMNHQSIIYPKIVFEKYTYNLRYKVFADYALNLLLWGDAQFKKQHYPISIVLYNLSGFSFDTKDPLFVQDKLQLIRQGMGWKMYMRMLVKRYKKKLLGKKDDWAP
jgi:glycosyltransferase involved in cell wall biosynthesis